MAAAPQPNPNVDPTPIALLRNREYLLLWGGQIVSTFGSSASAVIYPLLILALTSSPEAAGIASALRFAPYMVFSLPAGALIDRWNRRRVMIFCDLGRALAVASLPFALWWGHLTVLQINLVSLIEGSLYVFFNLAEVAALPRVVPREQLPQATAQNEASFGAANVIGPSIGTTLFQLVGHSAPFVADAISYLVSALALSRIKTPFHTEKIGVSRGHLAVEIGEGIRWLLKQKLIRFLALITGGLNFVSAARPLILILLAKHQGASDAQIGLIFSAAGVGAIIGALTGGWLQRHLSFYRIIIAVLWLDVLLTASLALAPSFALIALVSGAIEILGPVYNVTQFSHRVALIPDALQGRVNSVFRLFAFGFMPLGAALSGYLLEHFDSRWTILMAAAVLLLLALASTLNPSIQAATHLGSD